MESNMTQQQYMPPMDQMQSAQPLAQEQANFIQDPTVQKFIQANTRNPLQSCLTAFIILVVLFLFFVFGGKLFGLFHADNIYHFIISLIVIIVLYVISLVVASQFIKYPKDLLSLVYDRLRGI